MSDVGCWFHSINKPWEFQEKWPRETIPPNAADLYEGTRQENPGVPSGGLSRKDRSGGSLEAHSFMCLSSVFPLVLP